MGNPVVHFEIAGPDGPALQRFYRDLFGWSVEAQGEEFGFYGVVNWNEGGIGGGILQTQEGMPSNYVTVYIQVDDLQAALDKVSDAGGVVPDAADGDRPQRRFRRHVHRPREQLP